jgi:WS/DGAT/MGAT family acyltransferase
MSGSRLSGLDASFLEMETATAHMHVGWVAILSRPAGAHMPSFGELRDHIGQRLAQAPRYHHKLATAPLGLRAPEWVDDPAFCVERHIYWAPGPLNDLVDQVMSVPLRRDRPLWEIWICDDAGDGACALVGKLHHCMVDGIAAVELGMLLLDPTPDPDASRPVRPSAAAPPAAPSVALQGLRELAGEQLELLRAPLRVLGSPLRAARQGADGAISVARALTHSLGGAPDSVLNGPLSPLRRVARTKRPLDDLRTVKQAYGTTVNDVLLAAVAGGIRTYLIRCGEDPVTLKAMVPVNVRGAGDVLGNRISFVFPPLPCDDPEPLGRLYRVHRAMSQRKRCGEPEGADLALRAAGRTPGPVQHAIARTLASPHTFNLVVSNIPGPRAPMYMRGCRLEAAYPVVPLADGHALSVGMTTVCDTACFGIYADPQTLPDVDALAADIDDAIAELLARTHARPTRSGRGTLVAVPDIDDSRRTIPPSAARAELTAPSTPA